MILRVRMSDVRHVFFLVEFTHSCRGTIYHIPPWEKENHLQKWLGRGYVSSLEGSCLEMFKKHQLDHQRKKEKHVVKKKRKGFPRIENTIREFQKKTRREE